MSWKAIAQSVIGTSHIKSERPCQDYGNYKIVNDNILIGAVADGAGSARHSDIGSRLAVQTTLEHLNEWMLNIIDKGKTDLSNPIPEDKAINLFNKTLNRVLNRFNKELEEVYEYSLRDLSCTLLAFVVTPDWIAAMQIGDGFIVMRSQSSNSNYQLLFPPAKGEYANQTTFVTSPSASSELQVKVISEPPKFIFAATDGLERMAIDFAKQQAHSPFFRPFEKAIEQNGIEEEKQDIVKWLNSEQVNSKTDDDKTILICFQNNVPAQIHDVQDRNRESLNTNTNIDQKQLVPKKLVKQSSKSISPQIQFLAILVQIFLFGFLSSLFLQYLTNAQSQKALSFLLSITVILLLAVNSIIAFSQIKNQAKKTNQKDYKEHLLPVLTSLFTGVVIAVIYYYFIDLLLGLFTNN